MTTDFYLLVVKTSKNFQNIVFLQNFTNLRISLFSVFFCQIITTLEFGATITWQSKHRNWPEAKLQKKNALHKKVLDLLNFRGLVDVPDISEENASLSPFLRSKKFHVLSKKFLSIFFSLLFCFCSTFTKISHFARLVIFLAKVSKLCQPGPIRQSYK